MTSSQGTQAQGTVTEQDGTYSVSLTVAASDNEPVRWSIEAYTPEFRKLKLAGTRIVMKEDHEETVKMDKPLEFAKLTPEQAVANPVPFTSDSLDSM
jgi:hypothetical protein